MTVQFRSMFYFVGLGYNFLVLRYIFENTIWFNALVFVTCCEIIACMRFSVQHHIQTSETRIINHYK